jgi:hypothetical protein
MSISRNVLGVGVAGLLALFAVVPASAAPVLSSTSAVKSAADTQTTQVRWRNGGAVAAGVGVGLLAGAAIASSQQRSYYSDPYYAPAPAYAPGYYAAEPEYYAPAPSYGYYSNPYRSSRYYNGRADTNAVGNY